MVDAKFILFHPHLLVAHSMSDEQLQLISFRTHGGAGDFSPATITGTSTYVVASLIQPHIVGFKAA